MIPSHFYPVVGKGVVGGSSVCISGRGGGKGGWGGPLVDIDYPV